jgi:hypothetical protein
MIKFIARFSPRLQAALLLPKEVADIFVAVEDLLHDKGSDPAVQRCLNDIRALRQKLDGIRG